ncbi:hypothetical protein HN51_000734 [Arachis hypogaea]|uniref:Uncharacterized protein n=1 Tax=Arachis hypogaea TaxID=3818 RepID=A0A445EUN4_ARAHY|nr:uncharacterized protein LOC112722174 [Arachis hypogaea]QHO48714.1 uncharacterized protein DS421_1g07770 [Arachis hypogaea]RYR79218.1 hypothetical protein Ahy_A01g004043 [Arachis hypogaea]
MEDWNMLGADCVVISCCCQCLMLQILVYVLLKLPSKLVRKTRRYVKKKFCGNKRSRSNLSLDHRLDHREKILMGSSFSSYDDVLVKIHEQSIRFREEIVTIALRNGTSGRNGNDSGSCMDEVEKVMEKLYENGELAFGSFWGQKEPWGVPKIVSSDLLHNHLHNCDYDHSFVRYEIIELVGSIS